MRRNQEKRDAFVDERITNERTALRKQAEQKREQTVSSANAIVVEQTTRKDAAEATLASLGFFKFGDKKTQKAIIESAVSKINEAKLAISSAEATYKAEIEAIEKTVKNKTLSFRNLASKEYPMPEEPKKPSK